MRAWRVVVAIPLGFVAATVLANIVPGFFGVYRIDINQPSGQASAGVWLAGSILLPVYLVRHSPSVRETFRRSLPLIGFASLCLDLTAIVLVAVGVQGDPKANDPLSYAFAGLVLLAPVLCPVLYYWIVPSENRRPRTRTIRDLSDLGPGSWS